jgi:tRNA 2-selenouridine synthase
MSTISRPGHSSFIVSPLQLEVLDWTQYAKVFDVRSPQEYRKDHVPGAVNLPVTLESKRGRTALDGLDVLMQQHSLSINRTGRLLVYGTGSDRRTQLTIDYLRDAGFKVDTLYGGWQNYRRWVIASLEILPCHLTFRWLRGSIASGKGPLLHALGASGEQTLDLPSLADRPESILTRPDIIQPTQMLYESLLLEALRRMDARRAVWITAEKQRLGKAQIPSILYRRLLEAPTFVVTAPIEARTRLLFEQEPGLTENPLLTANQLASTRHQTPSSKLAILKSMAVSGRIEELCAHLMTQHYDPPFERAIKRIINQNATVTRLHLESLNGRYLRRITKQLTLQQS